MKSSKILLMALALPLSYQSMHAEGMTHHEAVAERLLHEAGQQQAVTISSASMINPTTAEIIFSDKTSLFADFYGENIFRLFKDDFGKIIRDPEATPAAQILVDSPRKSAGEVTLQDAAGEITLTTGKVKVIFNKATTLFKIIRLSDNKVVTESVAPIKFTNLFTQLRLCFPSDEAE